VQFFIVSTKQNHNEMEHIILHVLYER